MRAPATWNGRSTLLPAPWMPCSAPEVGERNEIVTSTSASRTRVATTARLTSALRAFDGYGVGFERWTDEAMTAARALREGGATALGYRALPLVGLGEPDRGHRLDERRAEADGLVDVAHGGVLLRVRGRDDRHLRMVGPQPPQRLELHRPHEPLAAVLRDRPRVVGEAEGRPARDAELGERGDLAVVVERDGEAHLAIAPRERLLGRAHVLGRPRGEVQAVRRGRVVHRRARASVGGEMLVGDAAEPRHETEAVGDPRLR